jgi:P27 family predicted phage terminase small subunit
MKGAKPQMREAEAPVADVEAPEWLSDDARAEWCRVMPDLTKRRILSDADLGGLENYCVSIGKVREFEREYRVQSDIEVKLKLFRAIDKAMGTARQIGAELGLTPVSRSRPAVRDMEEGDDDDNPLSV